MIGDPAGVAAHLIRSRGAGVVLPEPAEIAGQLRAWLFVKDRLGRIPEVPESALAGLSRDEQLVSYLALLKRGASRTAAPQSRGNARAAGA